MQNSQRMQEWLGQYSIFSPLLVDIGRIENDGLPKGAPLEVSGYGTMIECLVDGHDVPDEERTLLAALAGTAFTLAQLTPFNNGQTYDTFVLIRFGRMLKPVHIQGCRPTYS